MEVKNKIEIHLEFKMIETENNRSQFRIVPKKAKLKAKGFDGLTCLTTPVMYCLAGASADIFVFSVSSIRESESMRENLTSNLKFCDVAKKGDAKFRYQLTTQIYEYFLSKNFNFSQIFPKIFKN